MAIFIALLRIALWPASAVAGWFAVPIWVPIMIGLSWALLGAIYGSWLQSHMRRQLSETFGDISSASDPFWLRFMISMIVRDSAIGISSCLALYFVGQYVRSLF